MNNNMNTRNENSPSTNKGHRVNPESDGSSKRQNQDRDRKDDGVRAGHSENTFESGSNSRSQNKNDDYSDMNSDVESDMDPSEEREATRQDSKRKK